MLTKYVILIFINVLINNSLGENEMPSAWKTEMKKKNSEELGMELNKLKENLDKRFELIAKLENNLGDEFENKLEQLEETLGIKLTKLENNLREKLKSKLEEDLEKKLEQKLEVILGKKLEEKLEVNLGKKLEEKLEVNLGKKLEDSLKNKLKPTLEENIRKTLEEKLEVILGNKLEIKLEEKLEGKLEENLDKKFEDKFEKKQNTSQTEEWIDRQLEDVISLNGRAVIAGYEPDGSPLWMARGSRENNTVIGKLNPIQQYAHYSFTFQAKAPCYYTEANFPAHVLCAPPEKVRWVKCRNGYVPPNAVGGGLYNGEKVYVGRAKEQGSLTPGWVLPSAKCLYIIFNEKTKTHNTYEVLCLV